jgi:transcription antitermination factor NusG
MTPWFAIQTRPRHEKMVGLHLTSKGYETFLPTYRAKRRWSDRMKIVVLPLFEGYVFCRTDDEHAGRIILTPGVVRLVSVAGVPATIDDDEIDALRRIVASSAEVEPWPFLRVGDRVRIESGALAGIEGILESVRGKRRVIVSVTLLQRSVAVELDREVISSLSEDHLRLCR